MVCRMSNTMSGEQIHATTGISARTVRRVKELKQRTGGVVSHNPFIGCRHELDGHDIKYLLSRLDHQPELSLGELRKALETTRGVYVSEATISRTLKQQCYSKKSITRSAAEASDEARARFIMMAAGSNEYRPNYFVYVDETGVNSHTLRRRLGWAPVGA
ncbi:unnamed protein product [Rhizoctonia solani]|nr:unnamed protein product [Rhizoctonia solani]